MRVNKQKDIKVPKSGYKRSKFNWSHDVNTTYNWGEIQPTQCKMLVPGSKTTMQAQNLIRLAPMVAPTFGRVKFKTYNQFVPLAEVFPNFDAMMAQEPKTTAGGTQVPLLLPYTNLGELSSMVLHGSRCTLYYGMDTSDGRTAAQNASDGYYVTAYRDTPRNANLNTSHPMRGLLGHAMSAGVFAVSTNPYFSGSSGLPNVGGRCIVDLSKILRPSDHLSSFAAGLTVVTGLTSAGHLFPVVRDYTPDSAFNPAIPDVQVEVTMDSADYVIEGCYAWDDNGTTKYDYIALAFELSDSGKRLRKILQGCGYQIDFTSIETVSILPLLAQYKAYFDIFGLQLYQGWETTYCAKCIKYIENNFITSVSSGWYNSVVADTNQYSFLYFIFNELLNEWYTESADYIGAHMEKLAVSPLPDKTGFLSVNNTGGLVTSANISFGDSAPAVPDGTSVSQNPNNAIVSSIAEVHAYVNQLQHGQVDATLLMRMYRWTNKNSILGRFIAKILRAQGLGKYVDACNSNFIGSSDVLVTISDVVSTAATDEASLGEYGGRGLQYDSSGTLSFENDVYGYWITLASVVPEAGYTQGLDRTLTSLKKFDFYNPDFDAIGMELTPKNAVVATSYIYGYDAYSGHNGFGFIPRYSKFKVHQNLVNGDFNRHGKRSVYLPYTLDKQLNINDFNPTWSLYASDNSGTYYECGVKIQRSDRTQSLPVAGNVWRMPTKYAWLGNFNRIFLNIGKHDDDDVSTSLSQLVGFSDYNDDNFLCHSVYAVNCYAPMKPIEESYGLEEEEEPNSVGADFVSKA